MKFKNLLVTISMSVLMAACSTPNNQKTETTIAETTTAVAEQTTSLTQSVGRKVTIRSIGDILIHDFLYWNAATTEGYNFDHMFAPVKKYIEGADITTANMEVIASGDTLAPSSYPFFNSPSEIIDALQNVGVDIVNNASNHTLDLGADGALGSIEAMQERGMKYVGSYDSWKDYNTPRIIEVNGVKVGFLAYTYGTNGNPIPDDQEYLVTLIDTELIPLEIEALNEQVDVSVVIIQNGEEYDPLPSSYQANVMNVARDAGASFVLGGHPHVLQPFIVYNKHQAGLFSHGNFLSGQIETETKTGGIAEYTFTEVDGKFEISAIRFMPTYNLGDSYSDYVVVPLADWEEYGIAGGQQIFDSVVEHMRYYSNLVEVIEYLD